MTLRMTMVVLVCWVLCAITQISYAQKSDDDRAKDLYQQALQDYEYGDFQAAANGFRAAYELKPSWKLFFNIAQSETLAKRYGLALDAFEEYLAKGGDEINSERRKTVMNELDRLRQMVGYLKISAPAGATISIDGVARAYVSADMEIPVAIGMPHVIQAVVEGRVVDEKTVKVSGGKSVEIVLVSKEKQEFQQSAEPTETIDLAPLEEQSATSGPIASSQKKNASLKIAGWISLGTGVALLTTGGITGGIALSMNKKLSDDCDGQSCGPSHWDDVDKMNTLGTISDVFYIVGGTTAAAGIVMLIVSKRQKEKPQNFSLQPTPVFSFGTVGLIFRKGF